MEVIVENALVDEILGPHREELGLSYVGYRHHALRMMSFACAFTSDSPGRLDKLAVVTAFHDLPFFMTGDLDYQGRARDMARPFLRDLGRPEWEDEVIAMMDHHHKVRSYTGPYAELVEAVRRADWIDVTFTRVRFGLPIGFVRDVRRALPINEAYKGLALPAIGRYALRHPRRPLPMMRW